MDSNQEIEELQDPSGETAVDDSVSVDDFIKQLEEKEKDLHITADTTIIEIAEGFEDGELPGFLKEEFSFDMPAAVAPAVSTHAAVSAKPTAGTTQKEISELKQKISTMEEERAEMFKNSQRRAKDFETYKARTERERGDTFQNQVGNLATQMLPALDNLNRAIDFAQTLPEDTREEFQQFFDGIVLVNQQVHDVFAGMGIVPIKTVGEPFDPNLHEAVATEDTDEFPPNTVCGEMLRGYRVGDRVIRHSMVKVSISSQVTEPQPAVPVQEFELETFGSESDVNAANDAVRRAFESDDDTLEP